MITTLYIIVSIVEYYFFRNFSYERQKSLFERKQSTSTLMKFFKLTYLFHIINLVACAVLLLLKCFGLVKWWL